MARTGKPRKSIGKKTLKIAPKKRVARAPEPAPVVVVEEKEKKKNKNRQNSWSSYLFKVMKEVHPEEVSISRQSMSIMNDMMEHIFEIIAKEASNLSKINMKGKPRKTLLMRDVETAVKLILPGELAKIASSDGHKAVRRYELSYEDSKEE